MSTERWLVQLWLPWFSPGDEALQYSSMTLGFEGNIDKRLARRIIRKWYKEQIGRKIHKRTLERIWRRRTVQQAMSEERVQGYIDELARQTYEEAQSITDSDTQKETTQASKL